MTDSALPFGTYKVCVEARVAGRRHHAGKQEITAVTNWYHRGMKLPDIAVRWSTSAARRQQRGRASMTRLRSQAGFTLSS